LPKLEAGRASPNHDKGGLTSVRQGRASSALASGQLAKGRREEEEGKKRKVKIKKKITNLKNIILLKNYPRQRQPNGWHWRMD